MDVLLAARLEHLTAALGSRGAPVVSVSSQNDHQLLSLVLRMLLELETRETDEAWPATVCIDCREIRESRHLYDRVLNGFAAWPLHYSAAQRGVENWNRRGPEALKQSDKARLSWLTTSAAPSDSAKGVLGDHANASFPAFAAALSDLLLMNLHSRRTLVLTHADHLRLVTDGAAHGESTLVPSLIGLVQDSRFGLAIVFVSDTPGGFMTSGSAAVAPRVNIEVPPFEQEELVQMLLLNFSEQSGSPAKQPLQPASSERPETEEDAEGHRPLARSLADQVVQSALRSLTTPDAPRALVQLCNTLWAQWIAPVQRGAVRQTDVGRLANAIKDPLKTSLERLEALTARKPVKKSDMASLASSLPLSGKTALLATFLACYNPSRTDARLFGTATAGQARKAKRRRTGSKHEQSNGPKAVPIERIHAVYEALMGQTESQSVSALLHDCDGDFYMQLASLVSMSLVLRTAPDRLDSVKLKVVIEREEAAALAQRLGLMLDDWMAV